MKPRPKVAAASIAGAATVVVVFAVGQLGIETPPEVAAALTTLLAAVAGWLKVDDV